MDQPWIPTFRLRLLFNKTSNVHQHQICSVTTHYSTSFPTIINFPASVTQQEKRKPNTKLRCGRVISPITTTRLHTSMPKIGLLAMLLCRSQVLPKSLTECKSRTARNLQGTEKSLPGNREALSRTEHSYNHTDWKRNAIVCTVQTRPPRKKLQRTE